MFAMALNLRSFGSDSLYPYTPVKPLPYVFAVIIFLLACVNIWQNFIKWKWPRFGFIMTWASSVWVAAFICRAVSENKPDNLGIYIAQYVLIIAGPPLYGAAETFILGRLMAYMPYSAPIHPGRVVTTFVILSVVVETVAARGSALTASAYQPLDLNQLFQGLDYLNAALVLQCCVELLFLSLTAMFHYKASRACVLPRNVKIMIFILYLTSSMLLGRCAFRAAQGFSEKTCLSSGNHCGILTHEVYLWIFEVANISLFVLALTIFTPGRFLPSTDLVFLDKTDGVTERLGPGFQKLDNRRRIFTYVDPFNFYSKLTGQATAQAPFWEEAHPVFEGDLRKGSRREGSIEDGRMQREVEFVKNEQGEEQDH